MRALFLSAIIAAMPFHQALSWGQDGHSIIAEIAQRRLDPAVAEKIKKLLVNTNVSLASLSMWADDNRIHGKETSRWHFVHIPLEATGFDPARDCAPTELGDCAVAAIEREVAILADENAPSIERSGALRFVINLVADVHQPLRCAERDGDAGGDLLTVTYSGNRHPVPAEAKFLEVWDSLLIKDAANAWGAYELEGDWFANNQADFYATGAAIDWVNECHQMAVKAYGTLPADLKLDDSYLQANFEMLDRQLAVGGIRLARVLNEALR